MSSDIMPNLFPDRPIRPLPKRRLRERLSPQVAESIKYPPSTLNSVPLFQYPCSLKEEETHSNIGFTSSSGGLQQAEPAKSLPGRRNGGANGTDGIETGRSRFVTRSVPEILTRAMPSSSRPEQSRSRMQPAPSTPSSVDGYDSFENTNNKKKRKIPSAGDSALNSAHGLNIDMSSHPTSANAGSPSGEVNGDHSLYSSAGYTTTGSFGSAGQGISGSGRGRLGRSRNCRSPLRALSDGNNLSASRASKSASQWSSEHPGSSGIIRNAIANAGKLPPQGEENVSLLQQHSVRSKGTPSSSQFTFTCDSQVTGTLHWPAANSSRHGMGPQSGAGFINGAPVAHHEDLTKAANRDARRKTRRQAEKDMVRAAEARRQSTAKRHYLNPPKPEDFWICEFCEYEAIFGEPPRALIRQYEVKDRRFRQEEADRKRLLEKAKQKGRKGKKNGKPSSKGSSMTNQHDSAGAYETNVPPRNQSGNSQSTQSEDDEDEQAAESEETYHTPRPSRPGNEEDRGGGPSRRRGVSVDSGGAGIPRAPTPKLAVP
ncbi:unnamed protein product [Clonostachys solani]|uniref:Uncharacterized protein n=1 Tax=Clonostachys solani TaxID=160281 RepID=A0A9N9W039_9HYPO|nr:unnamed protein product [Clonostachys solani]